MKIIGLIGGMSWESTVSYYRQINEGVKKKLGSLHSARIVLHSVDFEPITNFQHSGDWDAAGSILADAARSVEAGGAEFLLICTNTMHKVADQIERAVSTPLLHIADATAWVLVHNDMKKIGLLGTAFTMEREFYKGRLSEKHGLDVIVPDAPDRKLIHDIIYQELCLGDVEEASKQEYIRIVNKLTEMGVISHYPQVTLSGNRL